MASSWDLSMILTAYSWPVSLETHFLTVLERPLEEEGRGKVGGSRAEQERAGDQQGSSRQSCFPPPPLSLSLSPSLPPFLPPSLPPSLLSQDFFGFVFSVKQPALHALLARQHPWGNPPQQLIITHYYWHDILYWYFKFTQQWKIRIIRTQLELWLLSVSVRRLPQRT